MRDLPLETGRSLSPAVWNGYALPNMASSLALDDTLVASRDQVFADLAGEIIILGMRDGAYFGATDTAARIWALLQTPQRLDAVVETLTREYNVPADRCAADVLAFAEELVARGLAVRDVAPAS